MALLVGKTLYVANAGDLEQHSVEREKFVELSYDHKPENPIEYERIVASGAKV